MTYLTALLHTLIKRTENIIIQLSITNLYIFEYKMMLTQSDKSQNYVRYCGTLHIIVHCDQHYNIIKNITKWPTIYLLNISV